MKEKHGEKHAVGNITVMPGNMDPCRFEVAKILSYIVMTTLLCFTLSIEFDISIYMARNDRLLEKPVCV